MNEWIPVEPLIDDESSAASLHRAIANGTLPVLPMRPVNHDGRWRIEHVQRTCNAHEPHTTRHAVYTAMPEPESESEPEPIVVHASWQYHRIFATKTTVTIDPMQRTARFQTNAQPGPAYTRALIDAEIADRNAIMVLADIDAATMDAGLQRTTASTASVLRYLRIGLTWDEATSPNAMMRYACRAMEPMFREIHAATEIFTQRVTALIEAVRPDVERIVQALAHEMRDDVSDAAVRARHRRALFAEPRPAPVRCRNVCAPVVRDTRREIRRNVWRRG